MQESTLRTLSKMHLLDFLFPKRCLGCGRIGKYFCIQCVGKIRIIAQRETICPVCERPAISGATHPICKTNYSIDGLTSFFQYEGIIQKAIKALKYRFVSDLASEFVGLIPQSFFSDLTNLRATKPRSFLVPIPLHSARLRYRGFNQAELLGTLIAEKLHTPVWSDVLKRVRSTTPQVETKDRNERLENMKKVFACNHLATQPSNHVSIFLFDDVFTTGATMRSAASVLKRAGSKHVHGITITR